MSNANMHPIRSGRGMVASAHPLATLAGLEMLMKGGNAVDAALAAAGVTMVTLPDKCGLGGDAFMLIHLAGAGRTVGMGGSGKAALGATPSYFHERGHTTMPLDGILSVAVPGAPGAFQDAWTNFGSMDWGTLWEPALYYAGQGFPVTEQLSASLKTHQSRLRSCPSAGATLFPGGDVPQPGQTLVQADLARSFETLANHGAEPFYRGEMAERYLTYSQQMDGLFQGPEFTSYITDMYPSLTVDYRGYVVHQTRPPSQGLIMLEALSILAGHVPGDLSSDELMHLMIEATKLAFADRLAYAGDPKQVDFSPETLLADDHVASRRQMLNPETAMEWPGGAPGGDTTSLVVIDAQGNAVSLIHSLSHAFGSGIMVPDTGILLNNRAGRGFSLDEGHPNQIAPGKRTMHTLNTYLVTRDNQLFAVGNTPGGDGQPQWNLQVLSNLVDGGMTAQEAVSAPRWTIFPGTDPARVASPGELRLEEGIPAEAGRELARRGHPVSWVGRWNGGGQAQVIIARDGGLEGGTDPRAPGAVLGF